MRNTLSEIANLAPFFFLIFIKHSKLKIAYLQNKIAIWKFEENNGKILL